MAQNENDYFGLDIGNTGMRLVQLRKTGDTPTLVSYGAAPLPLGLAMSDSPMDQDKAAEVLRGLLRDAKISTTNVVAGIPSAQAFVTVVTTPKLSSEELGKAMKLQADQYIPMAVDQVKMDWQVIGPGKTDQEMKVLLVAAPNTIVTKYLNVVEKAGLHLLALEVDSVALGRSLMAKSDLAALIVDVGSMSSDIVIIHQAAPQLARSVNIGGQTFIKSVGQALGLDDAQAEQFTKKFGLTQTKLEGQVLKAIKPSMDTLVSEIEKSVKFFSDNNPGVKLEKLILTGGTSALPELTTYLGNAIGLPVALGNSWTNVSYPADQQATLGQLSSQFAVAVGLAERAFL